MFLIVPANTMGRYHVFSEIKQIKVATFVMHPEIPALAKIYLEPNEIYHAIEFSELAALAVQTNNDYLSTFSAGLSHGAVGEA